MATDAPAWHEETLSNTVKATLRELNDRSLLNSFYLAGGTALALRFGHRRSVDLDFFSEQGFDPDDLIQGLLGMEHLAVVSTETGTLHVTIRGVKVSFLAYRYPMLFPFAHLYGVPVADPRDIACMKVTAIASRGTKRDFVDLYEAAQRLDGLKTILDWSSKKYAAANYSRPHLLKSLTFFNNAEQDPMPDMLIPCDWAAVKRYFAVEAPQLL